jgi:hypothetical protein
MRKLVRGTLQDTQKDNTEKSEHSVEEGRSRRESKVGLAATQKITHIRTAKAPVDVHKNNTRTHNCRKKHLFFLDIDVVHEQWRTKMKRRVASMHVDMASSLWFLL